MMKVIAVCLDLCDRCFKEYAEHQCLNDVQMGRVIRFDWREAHPRLLDAAMWLMRNRRSQEILQSITIDSEFMPFQNEPSEGCTEKFLRTFVPESSPIARIVGLYELPVDIPAATITPTTFNLGWRILRQIQSVIEQRSNVIY